MEYLTIGWNVIEAAVALISGVLAGSIALIGFGIDSVIEVGAAAVVIWELKGADKQREARALRLIAVSFFGLALYIIVEAVRDLVTRSEPSESAVGIILAALSLVVMPLLARAKHRTGHEIESRALVADAAETLLCAYLSLILLSGLTLNALFGWWWADPIAAVAIAVLAIREGLEAWRGEEHEH